MLARKLPIWPIDTKAKRKTGRVKKPDQTAPPQGGGEEGGEEEENDDVDSHGEHIDQHIIADDDLPQIPEDPIVQMKKQLALQQKMFEEACRRHDEEKRELQNKNAQAMDIIGQLQSMIVANNAVKKEDHGAGPSKGKEVCDKEEENAYLKYYKAEHSRTSYKRDPPFEEGVSEERFTMTKSEIQSMINKQLQIAGVNASIPISKRTGPKDSSII